MSSSRFILLLGWTVSVLRLQSLHSFLQLQCAFSAARITSSVEESHMSDIITFQGQAWQLCMTKTPASADASKVLSGLLNLLISISRLCRSACPWNLAEIEHWD